MGTHLLTAFPGNITVKSTIHRTHNNIYIYAHIHLCVYVILQPHSKLRKCSGAPAIKVKLVATAWWLILSKLLQVLEVSWGVSHSKISNHSLLLLRCIYWVFLLVHFLLNGCKILIMQSTQEYRALCHSCWPNKLRWAEYRAFLILVWFWSKWSTCTFWETRMYIPSFPALWYFPPVLFPYSLFISLRILYAFSI